MFLKGRAHVFGDDINTDYIISGQVKFKVQDPKELAKHVMGDIRPGFYNEIQKGDILVAGRNFGCGSSREQAPMAIKYANISAVVAKSFARIFYRNCFNLGLLAIEADTTGFDEADQLEIDLDKGILKNLTKNKEIKISPLPPTMQKLLEDGGLIEHFKKHGGFKL